jgi:spore maturation protein CgeB
LRILYLDIHPLWIHTLPKGFVDLGHEVEMVNPLMEQETTEKISQFQPDLLISIGWTYINHYPGVQELLGKYSRKAEIPHAYWSTEDPTHTETFSIPYIQRSNPDFVFTVCQDKVGAYQKMNIKSAFLDFGYHPSVHFPAPANPKYQVQVAVVANGYRDILNSYTDLFRIKSMETLILPLLQAGLRIDFWGSDWERMGPILGYEIPADWIHGHLPYIEANQVYSNADIILGLQNNTNQLTQRTYEILASGGFVITSETPAVRTQFEPGKDLLTSSNVQETMALVSHYLQHPEERRRIREQGRRSVEPHSYQNRAKFMITTLQAQGII